MDSTAATASRLVDFQVSKQHRRFVEFADAVRRHRYIGACAGRKGHPGVTSPVPSRYSAVHTETLTQPSAQEQLLKDWVLWQRGRGMSDKTITDRLAIIRRVPDAASITPQGVDRFLTSAAWAKATRANYHGAIRAWCKWLIITGRRADDPTLIATTPKVKKGRPRPVADEHLTILLDTRMYRRTRAMILLAAYAGLRVSEIAAIKGDDVDTVINTITVTGKGDKERQIPLHPILKDLAAVMPRRGWWFSTYIGNTKHLAGGPMLGNSVSASISNVMDRAGIPGTPHALRHWFGSALREAGVDSLIIKELMGHESLATTAIYVDVPLKQRSAALSLLPKMVGGLSEHHDLLILQSHLRLVSASAVVALAGALLVPSSPG